MERYQFDQNQNKLTDEKGAYAFNARNQISAWTRADDYEDPGTTVDYKLDGSGQITQETDHATDAATVDYHYLGERLDYTVATPNQGGPVSQTAYGYDAFGNMTKTTTTVDAPGAEAHTQSFEFDEFSRRISATETDEPNETYRYDGLDRRVHRTKGAKDFDSSYIGLSEQLAEEEQSGGTDNGERRSYDYSASGERLGLETQADGESPEEGTYKPYALDSQGSVLGLEDETTGVIAENDRYRYDPYGSLEFGEGQADGAPEPEDALSGDAADNPFRFQGHYFDSGVGVYDMKARSYLPDVGRFTSEDRYEAAGTDLTLQSDPLTQNRYAFAGGNPVSQIEWDGHFGAAYDDYLQRKQRNDRSSARSKRSRGQGGGYAGDAPQGTNSSPAGTDGPVGDASPTGPAPDDSVPPPFEPGDPLPIASDVVEAEPAPEDNPCGGWPDVLCPRMDVEPGNWNSSAPIVQPEDGDYLGFLDKASNLLGVSGVGKAALKQFGKGVVKHFSDDAAEAGGKVGASAAGVGGSRVDNLLGTPGDVVVIGRQADTAVAKNWPGHVALDAPRWSKGLNDEWVQGAILQQRRVYVASPTKGNLIQTSGPYAGKPTVFAGELRQFKQAGYTRRGEYLEPPG